MKVLVIAPDYPPSVGGIQRVLHNMVSHLPGAEVKVLASQVLPDGHHGGRSVDIIPLPLVHKLSRSTKLRSLAFNMLGLRQLYANYRPDVIINGHLVAAPLCALLAWRFRVPLVTYIYGKEVAGRPGMAKIADRYSHSFVSVSQYTLSLLEKSLGRQPRANPHIIHSGTDSPLGTEAKDWSSQRVLTVGRIRDAYKGHDVMLEAWPSVIRKHPLAEWRIVGDGKLRRTLEDRVAQLGVEESVTFLGEVDDEELEQEFREAAIFSMPTRYPKDEVAGEGFPVVYVEAGRWKLPSVSGDTGGPVEAVQDQITGIHVDAESPTAVANALDRLLGDENLRQLLGEAAYERVVRELTWDKLAHQLIGVLNLAVANNE